MEICKKIDVHAHAVMYMQYEYSARADIVVTPEDLFTIYDKVGVDHAVLMPIVSPEAMRLVIPNGNTCALAHQYPDTFFWFCNIDPRMVHNRSDSELGDMMEFFKSNGAKGMGELTANLWADDPMLDNLFDCCEAYDMPVTIHVAPRVGGYYGIADDLGLPRIKKMLKRHPDLRLIGHSQPFWAEIDANVNEGNRNSYPTGKITEGNLSKLLRECENLYMDMSAGSCYNALTRDPDYTYRFIEEFGDRMMYAIDYCHPENLQTYAMAEFIDNSFKSGCISEKNYRGICRENAIRILKLGIE